MECSYDGLGAVERPACGRVAMVRVVTTTEGPKATKEEVEEWTRSFLERRDRYPTLKEIWRHFGTDTREHVSFYCLGHRGARGYPYGESRRLLEVKRTKLSDLPASEGT